MGVISPRTLPLAIDTRPTVALPDRWTFWAETMVGNVALGMVDVSSFYCVRRLSNFGHGNVTVNLPCGIPGTVLRKLWSWRLWAFYGGQPYWCGVPTGLADQDGSAHVQLTLIELPGYLTKRAWDVYPDRRYVNTEQTAIARDIAAPVEDVGVIISVDPGTGYRRDRTYEFLEGGSRGQLLINLAGVLGGPEFRTEYRMNPYAGRPECVLRIAYPRVGNDGPGLGVTVPGAAVGYRAQWDADEMRTTTFAVGDLPHDAAEGAPRPVAIRTRQQADLPRLDAVDDWPGTVLQSTLEERANTMAERQAAPALAMTASPPEELPDITEYGAGDTVSVRAVTPLIPDGMEVAGRLSQVEVNAAAGVATWTIIGTTPAQIVRETVNDKLERLDSTLAQVFHSGELAEVGTPITEANRVTGKTTAGSWTSATTAWSRISDYGVLAANAPVGSAVVIEASGLLDWRNRDVELGLSWTGGPPNHVCNSLIEAAALGGLTNVGMAMHCRVTAIVASPGQLRGHLFASISPWYGVANRVGRDNSFVLEGYTEPAVGFASGAEAAFNIVARMGTGGVGSGVRMFTTKVTWYGGAQP